MLKNIRKSAHSYLTKLILLAIAVSLISFYGYRNVSGCHPSSVAKVNGHLISEREYFSRLQNQSEMYRRILGRDVDESMMGMLRQSVIDNLINRQLLIDAAREARFSVSDEAVSEEIAKNFSDPKSGKFDYDFYKNYVMRAMHMPPHKFEEQMRADLLASKFQEWLAASVKVSDAEAAERYKVENRQLNYAFISLNPGTLPLEKEPTEAELRAYYDKHQAEFQSDAMRKIEYVYLDPKEHGGDAKEAATHLSDTLKNAGEKSWKEAVHGSKAQYGATNFVSRKGNIEGIKDSGIVLNRAFDLKPGEVSEPLKGWLSNGYYVVRVLAEQQPKPLDYAAAKERTHLNYMEEERVRQAEAKLDKAAAELKQGKDFEAVAKAHDLAVGETGFFKVATTRTVPKVGYSAELGKELMALSADPAAKNRFSERPLKVGASYYLFYAKAEQAVAQAEIDGMLAGEKQRILGEKQQQFLTAWMKETRQRADKAGKVAIYRMEAVPHADDGM